MTKAMQGTGIVLMMLGIASADSEILWIPLAMVLAGYMIFKKGEELDG